MILDSGKAIFYRKKAETNKGDMYAPKSKEIFKAFFGYRTIGFSRYFTAKQVNAKVDAFIRILRPVNIQLLSDDICVLQAPTENGTYRIIQVQYVRDEDAGEDVADITLERISDKYECEKCT